MNGDSILILNFGGGYAQSMARKLRGERFFCEVVPANTPVAAIRARAPKGILLAGGAGEIGLDSPDCSEELFQMGIPILAMGYGARLMALRLGGQLIGVQLEKRTCLTTFSDSPLFDGLNESDRYYDRIDTLELPEGFSAIAFASGGLVPAFGDEQRKLFGLQFYAESNDPDGLQILGNFARIVCGCEPWWSMNAFIEKAVPEIQNAVGEGQALMAISGGVDSSVCAALMHRAIGNRLKCLYINTGLMRKGETELVRRVFREELGMELIMVDASEQMLQCLEGIRQPEEKRQVVEKEVSRVFAEKARALGEIPCLVQGTIYPDVLSNPDAPKSFPEHGRLVEPLRLLFKDEVRQLGEVLGVPKELICRQPFPEPGLAVRMVGEVTHEKLDMLREADAIFRSEIADAGLDRRIWMYFAVLTDIRTRGLRDGLPCYEYAVALRAVSSQDALAASAYRLPYDLLERVTLRITTEVRGINRVLYDVTGKPSAMIEWE